MTLPRLMSVCCLVAMMLAHPVRAADERGLPAMEQLQEMLEQKQYQPLLQNIARVLALRGEAAKAYDRGKVLILKGEAHLQMKAGAPAVAAFNEAAEEATDPKDAAIGRATAMLIKESDQFKYRPKTGGLAKVTAFDILTQRKEAFEALRDDELAEVTPKVRYARGARTLPAIISVVKSTQGLRALEIVTTGEAVETRKLLDGLADHAAKLLNDEIFNMETRLAMIEKQANEIIPVRDRLPDGQIISSHRRQGLTDRNMKDIRSIIATCEKIVPVSKELSELFAADDGRFAGAAGGAARLYDQARSVLQTDYTGMAERLGRERR